MLAYFTDPYPDELLYSVFARLKEALKPSSDRLFNLETIGREEMHWNTTFLVNGLYYFLQQLPEGNHYTYDVLVYNHTLLPYYSPFVSENVLKALKSDVPKPLPQLQKEPLKFCQKCVEADQTLYGEAYWHRMHQVPGVKICSIHKCYLLSSNVPGHARTKLTSLRKFLAEEKADLQIPMFTQDENKHLLRITEDSAWIINNKALIGNELIKKRLYFLFNERKWLIPNTNRINIKAVINCFTDYYTEAFLKKIGYSNASYWLRPVIENHRKPVIKDPLKYLLVMGFLGYSSEQFFNSNLTFSMESHPIYGAGPWPCLNPVSNHYNKKTINSFTVRSKKTKTGVFKCPECGYTYICKDFNTSSSTTLEYGPVWERELLKMINQSVPLKTIADRFQLHPSTIVIHRDRIKSGIKQSIPVETEEIMAEKILKYRARWLEIVNSNPSINITGLVKLSPGVFQWLSRYDRKWLDDHKPSVRYNKIDWADRDRSFEELSRSAVEAVIQREPLIRLTTASILREMGLNGNPPDLLNNLPKTKEVITCSVENHSEFQIRRIYWAGEYYKHEMVCPPKHKLAKKAGIGPKDRSRYDAVFDKVLESINKAIGNAAIEAAATLDHM